MDAMKIISLRAENIKRLKAVEITPDGSLVQITGANGQGKTSVLDAIWWALQGGKNIQTTPIRDGEESALITLNLGKYQVQRTFKRKDGGEFTTKLKVTTEDGAQFSTPQEVLNRILGELTFDPLAFTRMKPAEQVKALQRLAPDFDFTANEQAIADAYDERRVVNRSASEKEVALSTMGELPDVIPAIVDPADAMRAWQDALKANEDIHRREENRKAHLAESDRIEAQIKNLTLQLEERRQTEASWPDLPAPHDVDALEAKVNSVSADNKIAEVAERRKSVERELNSLKAESERLTKVIDDGRAAAAKAIAAASIPVDGMSITEGGVTLDGVPFDQASDAQQLHASIAIAMALNPTLRVIRVRDGSLLDKAAMQRLADLATAKDYQVWIEKVDDTGEIGFVIEDGRVRGQDIEPTPPKPANKAAAPKKASKPQDTLF